MRSGVSGASRTTPSSASGIVNLATNFFFWMEATAAAALCGTLTQSHKKIWNANYCRDEIRGARDSPGCRAFVQDRAPVKDNCAWHAWGAYEFAEAMIREEWARAAWELFRTAPAVDERPCAHVPGLPANASYAVVYFRCGDIATTFANSYGFLHPDWLRGFLPTLVNDAAADYVLLLGNRGSHGDQRPRTLCEGYFGELKKHVASMTSKPVLVAPEGFDDNARWGIIRDIRCMTQSAALVD
mmetsp:Transcript_11694/g.36057  ORF Transcript_11694/g.36057 Transcript_11694/m.36057 type:complete len:242 (-) Transcript_11694:246-971(-)